MIKETVRKLRKNETPQEKIMWSYLRNRNLEGVKFFRQHAIKFIFDGKERFFVADFYCSEKNLVIELDGSVHDKTKEYDSFRDSIIKMKGLEVMRFSNDEVENNIDFILDKIRMMI